MFRLAFIIAAAALCCGCYDRHSLPDDDRRTDAPTWSIAELHGYWYGKPFVIAEDAVVRGIVTSDDYAGNFYRTFTIRDESGGAEILAGIDNLHNICPVGCRVSVRLKGCAADEERGVLRIGLPAEAYDYDALEPFGSKVEFDKRIERDGAKSDIDIPALCIADLDPSLCGTPVTVEGLTFMPDGDDSRAWSGYARFADGEGNLIFTYTSAYADFADELVPEGGVALTGILQYGKVPDAECECFILKMRSSEDCRAHN